MKAKQTSEFHVPASTKKRLLTRDQRKHLSERVRRHASNLDFSYCAKIDPEPEAVKAARKLVKDWENQQSGKVESFNKRVWKQATKVTDSLVFDDVETALESVVEFEKLKRDDFRDQGMSRKGRSPNWDKL